MIQLASPDIDYKIAHTRADLDILEWEMGAQGMDPELLARSRVTEREYEATLAEYRGLLDQKARLEVTAPIAGKVVDVDDGLAPGMWVKAKSRLASVINPAAVAVEAYVDEADLDRIAVGDPRHSSPRPTAASKRRCASSRSRAPARTCCPIPLSPRSMAARSRSGPRSRTN